ncbi:MAG: aspartate dehydrogenase [Oscillospiraceae bacterium]|nr:aspartate dehydrogenase [Oscillospiraceae bacterium]
MGLFKKEKTTALCFPPEQYEPVIRCSICTGEQVACMRERATGRLREILWIRGEEDLEEFRRLCRLPEGEIRKIY